MSRIKISFFLFTRKFYQRYFYSMRLFLDTILEIVIVLLLYSKKFEHAAKLSRYSYITFNSLQGSNQSYNIAKIFFIFILLLYVM